METTQVLLKGNSSEFFVLTTISKLKWSSILQIFFPQKQFHQTMLKELFYYTPLKGV
jgi:hypothetical protein